MLPYFAKVEDDGKIWYCKFLERYKIDVDEKLTKTWLKQVGRDICMKLRSISSNFEDLFNHLDSNKDGRLDYKEWTNALTSFELGLSGEQMFDLMRQVDLNKNGFIEYKEFVNRFQKQFDRVEVLSQATWISDAFLDVTKAIAEQFDHLSSHKMRLKSAFRKLPTDDDDKITHELFAGWLVKVLHLDKYSMEDRLKLALYVDANNNGKISWKEFKHAFFSLDGTNASDESVLLHVTEAIIRNKAQLLRAFQALDTEKSGMVDVVKFKAGLTALNVLLDTPLSENQIKKLHQSNDKDSRGFVNYEDFLNSFNVKDTTKLKPQPIDLPKTP